MPAVKSQSKEETSETRKKSKNFFSKLRPHRHHKKSAATSPPAVVNVNDQTPTTSNSTVTFQDNKPKPKKPKAKLKTSWLSRSKWFTKLSDNAFAVVDADGSGEVDEKELYSGLLLIHLKLGCYAGPAACRPVDRARVHQVFETMDVDDSGSLDKEEFREVMMVLCSNIFTRVLIQCAFLVFVCVLVACFTCGYSLLLLPFVASSHHRCTCHSLLPLSRVHDAHYCSTRGPVYIGYYLVHLPHLLEHCHGFGRIFSHHGSC